MEETSFEAASSFYFSLTDSAGLKMGEEEEEGEAAGAALHDSDGTDESPRSRGMVHDI